jgi:hypothetical protein
LKSLIVARDCENVVAIVCTDCKLAVQRRRIDAGVYEGPCLVVMHGIDEIDGNLRGLIDLYEMKL